MYDFAAEPGNNELTVNEGEIITITNPVRVDSRGRPLTRCLPLPKFSSHQCFSCCLRNADATRSRYMRTKSSVPAHGSVRDRICCAPFLLDFSNICNLPSILSWFWNQFPVFSPHLAGLCLCNTCATLLTFLNSLVYWLLSL